MPPDPQIGSPPSAACTEDKSLGGPPQYHKCYGSDGISSRYDPWHQPDPFGQPGAPVADSGVFNSSRGYSYAFVLWRYLLDWGDVVGHVTMKRGLVTALKGWPRHQDRTAAAACLFHFVRKGDNCQPDLTMFLVRHPAFVGFTWDPAALKMWLTAVEPDPTCQRRQQFDAGTSLELSTAWLERAHRYWQLFTTEPFPYDTVNMVDFWLAHEPGAPIVPTDRPLLP